MENKNIAFLDIDGVLCTFRSLWKGWAKAVEVSINESDFVNNLNGITNKKMKEIDAARESGKYPHPNLSLYNWPFDEFCVDYFNKIIKQNNADIVVISSWRVGRTVTELQELLNDKGIIGNIIDKTGREETRGLEIVKWLESNKEKYNIKGICIIDDESSYDISYLLDDYCLYDIAINTKGLKEKHIKESKVIFNKPFDLQPIIDKSNKIINHRDHIK